MKGLLLFFVVVDGLFLIEYTRKEKHPERFYGSGGIYEEVYYQKTEHQVENSLDDALAWINKKGAHSYQNFFGNQQAPPIDGFEFVALYKCERVGMFQIQVGEEKKVVQIPQEQIIPIMKWVTNGTILK